MNQLPDLNEDELCDLYPDRERAIRWFINEPRLMPSERSICVVCGDPFPKVNNDIALACSTDCALTHDRNRYQGDHAT